MESSTYDTRAPERQTVTMTRLNAAGQRLGAEVVDIELSNLRGGALPETSSEVGNTFCTSELYRQVRKMHARHPTTNATARSATVWSDVAACLPGQVRGPAVSEFEFITVYTKQADGHVTARQSEAVYRTAQSPQDVLSFRAGGRAVAFYDYDLDMRRRPPPSDAVGAAACVSTPKGYIQCV